MVLLTDNRDTVTMFREHNMHKVVLQREGRTITYVRTNRLDTAILEGKKLWRTRNALCEHKAQ